jgi:phytoene/squalene synthetase
MSERRIMGDPKIYRQYAEECRRLARSMPEEHRPALLKIAEAWTQLADETERRGRSGDDN